MVMTACAGGGASDVVATGAQAQNAAATSSTLNLFAYSTPKPGFDKVIPAFTQTAAGKGVQFQQSYGASGDQSRKVAAGASADVVTFSVEPDVTRLVKAGYKNDASCFRKPQQHVHGSDQVPVRGHIHREDVVPRLRLDVAKRRQRSKDGGIADQDVELPVALGERGAKARNAVGVLEVEWHQGRAAA